jgi:hypothetical protein
MLDCGKQAINTLLLLFRIRTLLHILYIRLSFVIVHSITTYSTISKVTVRPREMGTGGTLGNIKSRQRGPSKIRLCFLQSDLSLTERVTLPHTSVCMILNFHCLRVTMSYHISWRILPQVPLRELVESTSVKVSPTHYPR